MSEAPLTLTLALFLEGEGKSFGTPYLRIVHSQLKFSQLVKI